MVSWQARGITSYSTVWGVVKRSKDREAQSQKLVSENSPSHYAFNHKQFPVIPCQKRSVLWPGKCLKCSTLNYKCNVHFFFFFARITCSSTYQNSCFLGQKAVAVLQITTPSINEVIFYPPHIATCKLEIPVNLILQK